MTVRTRFAPSPTGYMHIGGMRTALFNWLWARHNGGKFILRIDDTDQQRHVEGALDPILAAFRWLGLDWDEGPEVGGPYGPYFQSERTDSYRSALDRLLASGRAYKDFDPPELVQADRQAAEQEKRTYLNVRRSLELAEAERAELESRGTPYVIRLLVDRSASVAIEDHVRGRVEWDCGLIADPVLCRADGSPLYNFTSVVDDVAFEITHVIRAEEHLTNTAVQALLFKALDHDPPQFAHVPFVAAPGSKEKLSKRAKHLEKYSRNPQFQKLFGIGARVLPLIGLELGESLNPVMVSYYETLGFLPDAVVNTLARLGWSLDDKTEIMSRETIIENFTLDRVVKSPAGLDPDKLLSFQEYWMGQRSVDDKADAVLPYLVKAGWVSDPAPPDSREFVERLVTALGERLKIFSDILGYDEYFVDDAAMSYDEKAFEKRLSKPPEAADLLRGFRTKLAEIDAFDAETLDAALHAYVEEQGVSIGQIIHALRVAVTGKPAGPGMFDCLALLGRERCVARIDLALARLSSSSSD